MRKILLATIFLGFMVTSAAAIGIGDVIMTPSYCTTVKDTARLTAAVIKDGDVGYRSVMSDPSSKCYDARMHPNVNPVRVKLIEELYDFTDPTGVVFTLFRAANTSSNEGEGYVWIHDAPHPHETPDEAEQAGWVI